MPPSAPDVPTGPFESKTEGSKENGLLAHALSGQKMVDEVQSDAFKAAADGGSRGLQSLGDTNAKDMNDGLEREGKLPERSADLQDATPGDKSANFQAMMSTNDNSQRADDAMNNALQNVEKKEE